MVHAKSWSRVVNKLLQGLAGLLLAQAAWAADAAAALWDRLQPIDSLSARFVQVVTAADGGKVQESAGTLSVRKPSRMHWLATEPYQEEVVIDGERVWFHDRDLAQVTVRTFTQDLGQLPALVFGSSRESLADAFRVEQPDADTFRLLPKQADNYVRVLTLQWSGGLPAVLLIEDNLGNHTALRFSAVVLNTVVDDSRFHFTVPDGVEVIDETGQAR